ncbi:UNVERIFIED_CONTAM: hypothetical protein Sindi_1828100 [Sesamum indicum]
MHQDLLAHLPESSQSTELFPLQLLSLRLNHLTVLRSYSSISEMAAPMFARAEGNESSQIPLDFVSIEGFWCFLISFTSFCSKAAKIPAPIDFLESSQIPTEGNKSNQEQKEEMKVRVRVGGGLAV